MNADDCGEIGFLESMVATMAVVLVLTAFLGLAMGASVVSSDPTHDLDPGMLTGEILNGEFFPGYSDYIESYVSMRGLSGATVAVTVPGGFCHAAEPLVIGSMEGDLWSRSMTSLVGCDGDRSVVAVFEVVLCVRTTADSSPWSMPFSSSR